MEYLYSFFDINNVFFHVLGYSMSYLEFIGTILNLWCVWLVAKDNVLTWPIGNLGVIFFMALFYQIRLYSDFLEQIYYLITGFYGWWAWLYLREARGGNDGKNLQISRNEKSGNIKYSVTIVVGSIFLGFLMSHINEYLPNYFPEKASFPYLDAFTTVMSFVATILMAHKKIECWYLWIVVDIIGIWLYYAQGVVFVSILYLCFLILAIKGLFNWKKSIKNI